MLNKWLTGIIEGDGTIYVPDSKRNSDNKLNYPYIKIAFHKKDHKLALKIAEILGYGSVSFAGANTVLWTVYQVDALIDLVNRLNGNMRTPKVHRLYLLIDWLNRGVSKLELDSSPLGSNAWLAGMSDADSNFNIILTLKKNKVFKVQTSWRLEFAQKTYHGKDQLYWAEQLSSFTNTTLYSRSRNIEGKIFSSFIVAAHNRESNATMIDYFNRFPLVSAKYLDFKDWVRVVKAKDGPHTQDLYDFIHNIKENFNNKRKTFNWEHLDNFFYI